MEKTLSEYGMSVPQIEAASSELILWFSTFIYKLKYSQEQQKTHSFVANLCSLFLKN